MAEHSTIEWTDATWNPVTGCSVVSPGCTNCYAMGLAGTRLKHHSSRAGLTIDTKAGPVWNGTVRLNEDWLTQPLRWSRPRMIFVCAHGDLFHESVPDAWIDRVFAVMALCPQHTFQVLTKRSSRMRAYMAARSVDHSTVLASAWGDIRCNVPASLEKQALLRVWPQGGQCLGRDLPWPLPNIWLGVSAEDQRRADERVPDLLATPAAVRFVSAEPLLGPIDFTNLDNTGDCRREQRHGISALWKTTLRPRLDWIIVGGESGPGARPMHPDWARSIRDQCVAAGVPMHFKQHGAWLHETQGAFYPPASWFDAEGKPTGPGWHFWTDGDRGSDASVRVGKKTAGRLLDGREHNGMPAEGRAG